MKKTVQNLKFKIESIKKMQTEGILEIKILGIQAGATEQASPTKHKRQKRESQAMKV